MAPAGGSSGERTISLEMVSLGKMRRLDRVLAGGWYIWADNMNEERSERKYGRFTTDTTDRPG